MARLAFAFLISLALVFCDSSGADNETEKTCSDYNFSALQQSVAGIAQYQLPSFSAANGLNLGAPSLSTKPIRQALVKVTDTTTGCELGTGNTNNSGNFSVTYGSNGVDQVKVNVTASIGANTVNTNYSATSNALVSVIDNTSSGALYSLVKSIAAGTASAGTMTAPVTSSGSGPFAILDVALDAYNLLETAEPSVQFTTLNINWSTSNTPTGGTKSLGQIGTSHWDGSALYILGQPNVDADEYDLPVVGHEFGHYVEATLFRSDSIGGSHSGSNKLDPRVAFGEGFGNAFGGMVLNSQVYFDTSSTNMTTLAVHLDLEDNNTGGTGNIATTNAGGHNETSVQRILWDLYDGNADTGDNLNLGFNPIYNALRNGQKNSPALTTIVSFAASYYATTGNPDPSNIISQEVTGGIVVNGMNHFGQGGTVGNMSNNETCRSAMYTIIAGDTVGTTADSINFTAPGAGAGSGFNKYCATMYYKYTPTTSTSRTFQITGLSANCDLDLYVYNSGSQVGSAFQGGEGVSESVSVSVTSGTTYVVEVRGWSRGGNSGNNATGGPCGFSYEIN